MGIMFQSTVAPLLLITCFGIELWRFILIEKCQRVSRIKQEIAWQAFFNFANKGFRVHNKRNFSLKPLHIFTREENHKKTFYSVASLFKTLRSCS